MSQPPTVDDRDRIDTLRDRLGALLGQVRRAADSKDRLQLLAFVGLVSWIDVAGRLFMGGSANTKGRMGEFMDRYAEKYSPFKREIYDGIRNPLLHEFGTRHVWLGHAQPERHLTEAHGAVFFNLETMVEDFEAAFKAFLTDLEGNPELRARVLPMVDGLIAPIRLAETQTADTLSASASESATLITRGPLRSAQGMSGSPTLADPSVLTTLRFEEDDLPPMSRRRRS